MILVTGGTGHVGDQVVRTLRKLGLDVRALVRKGSEYYWLNDTGCKFFFGDLRDPESLRRASNDCEALVVCSGVKVEGTNNHHKNVTVEGHQALFEAAKLKGIPKVVMLSCMGVGESQGTPAFHARRQAEEALVASGLEHTILRACVHECMFLELAYQIKDRGQAILPGAGTNRLSPIPARDLALMTAASLDNDTVKNRILDVGGTEVMSAMDAFELACKTLGVDASHRRVLPAPMVAIGRKLGTPVKRWAHRLGELHVWFTKDFVVTESPFDIPRVSLAEAMAASAQVMAELRDPEARERRQVHPQFYATVYEPGTVSWDALPAGPPPRRD